MNKQETEIAKLDSMLEQLIAIYPIIHSRSWMFPEMYSDLIKQIE